MSSPIYPNSKEVLKSGMLLQIDIIPGVKSYHGANCEGGILLADQALRKDIEEQYPELHARIQRRRNYIINTSGIKLPEEVLPTSSALAYFPPYLFRKNYAFVKE